MSVCTICWLSTIFLTCISCVNQKENVGSLSKIEVLYVKNWYMTTTLPLSCDRLLEGDFPYQKIEVVSPSELEKWSRVLKETSLKKWQGCFTGDCRICCLYYSNNNEIVMKLSLWPTGINLNDRTYMLDSSFIRLVKPYIPQDYF